MIQFVNAVRKYLTIFKISFQQEFAYKVNFIMWRVRNTIQILINYFLWSAIFIDSSVNLFGYDREKILTYIFGMIIVRALVLSARAMDVSSDISQGDLSNYLVRPISYFKYWFTRDVSSKVLNVLFATGEFLILYVILRPTLYFQGDVTILAMFALSIAIAIMIYFSIIFMVSSIPFWAPELGWGGHFIVTVIIVEFLSGSLFPIDILPTALQKVLMLTPFPYMIFFPIQIYIGKVSTAMFLQGTYVSLIWAIGLWFLMRFIWNRGMKSYQAFGR